MDKEIKQMIVIHLEKAMYSYKKERLYKEMLECKTLIEELIQELNEE